jgi:hypothetical protein
MGLVSLDNLTEGMVLKSDVSDRSGRLLLGCGVELLVKHIHMFRSWGGSEADIEGVDDQVGGASSLVDADPATLAAAESELRPLFGTADLSYPAMGELFRLCLLRKVRHEIR